MRPAVTILVSSCDAYADCWEPFFRLFDTYWPGCPYPVVLLTDTQTYDWPHLRLHCFQAGMRAGGQVPWGERLRRVLTQVETPLVLYLQEDFFLQAPVDVVTLEEFARLMVEPSWTHQETVQIGLCPRGSHGPFHLTEHPLLWEVGRSARYRFSLQPGLWNAKVMWLYTRPWDSAWSFEESSHIRARRTPGRILTVNRHVFRLDGRQVYPFDPRGITRGRWVRDAVVPLFAKHGIEVDYSQRGFLEDASPGARDATRSRWTGPGMAWERLKQVINTRIDRFRY